MALRDAIAQAGAQAIAQDRSNGKKPAVAKKKRVTSRFISQSERKKTATVAGGKFPIPPGDKGHAEAALARINQAKPPLTPAQKAKVRSVAEATIKGKR